MSHPHTNAKVPGKKDLCKEKVSLACPLFTSRSSAVIK